MKNNLKTYIRIILFTNIISSYNVFSDNIKNISHTVLESNLVNLNKISKVHSEFLRILQKKIDENQQDIENLREQIQKNIHQIEKIIHEQDEINKKLKNLIRLKK